MDNIHDKHGQLLLYLISSFEMAALQQMGKMKNPLTDKIERDLQQAQFSIDLLDMMKEKTKGNLNNDEQKFLEHVLGQLKLNYIDEIEKDKKEKEEKKESENK
jgi:hypothetical protein